MPFVVVQSGKPGENWVEPIPTSWIQGDGESALFPKNDKHLRRFAMSETEPGDNWVKISVRIKSVTFLSYDGAKTKCKDYCDEQTDTDSNIGSQEQEKSTKRKQRPVNRFSEMHYEPLRTRLDKGQRQQKEADKNLDENQSDDNSEASDGALSLSPLQTQFRANNHSDVTKPADSSRSVSDQSALLESTLNTKFVEMTIRKLNILDTKLNDVLKCLYDLNATRPEVGKLPFNLPLQTLAELKQVEDFLKTEENRRLLLQRLPAYTTTELGTKVSLMMNELISIELASRLNWKGSGKENQDGEKKEGLVTFPFVQATVLQYIGGPADLAANRIKKWLANAPAKLKGKST